MAAPTLNQSGFAAWRGVSRKTVTGWKHRGLLVLTDDGNVDVEASDAMLLGHGIRLPASAEGNKVSAPISGETIEEAAARIVLNSDEIPDKVVSEKVKEHYVAQLRRLEYDRESALVAEIEDVVIAVATELALVRNKLLNIGSRVAPRIAVMNSAEAIKAMIDAEVVLALQELTLDGPTETSFDSLAESLRKRFGEPS
jgi:hypothetical protein